MEVIICFKFFINALDLFIIIYKSRFERWFITGSCCGPANLFKSEQYKNCCLFGYIYYYWPKGSDDTLQIFHQHVGSLYYYIQKMFRTLVYSRFLLWTRKIFYKWTKQKSLSNWVEQRPSTRMGAMIGVQSLKNIHQFRVFVYGRRFERAFS